MSRSIGVLLQLCVMTCFGCVSSCLSHPRAAILRGEHGETSVSAPESPSSVPPLEVTSILPPDGKFVGSPAAVTAESAVFIPSTPPRVTKSLLRGGLHNPIPGAVLAGYAGDTGLDLAIKAAPIYAIGSAQVEYAEAGHTLWVGKYDSPYCVRLKLDVPIVHKKRHITHVYYAHLSALAFEQAEGAAKSRHVVAGEFLGTSGMARGMPHLHLGLLLDGQVAQDDWTYILREAEVRFVLGGYKTGDRLPKE